jgi:hypothetical protein
VKLVGEVTEEAYEVIIAFPLLSVLPTEYTVPLTFAVIGLEAAAPVILLPIVFPGSNAVSG